MNGQPDESFYRLNRRKLIKTISVLASGMLLTKNIAGAVLAAQQSTKRKISSFPKVVLHNFKLFDGLNNRLQKDLLLLIVEGKIQSIEQVSNLSNFKDYVIKDMREKTILPGLIDNHVHITVPFMNKVNPHVLMQMNKQIELNFEACLLSGVTTVRDTGGFPDKIIKYGARADKNEIVGPRIIPVMSAIAPIDGKTLGFPEFVPYFKSPLAKTITGGNFALRPRSIKEIKEDVEKMIRLGAKWIKSFYQEESYTYSKNRFPVFSDRELKTIVDTAKQHNIKCCIHQSFVNAFKKGVDAGFHTFEHTPMDAEIPDEHIDRFMENGTAIIPTLIAFNDSLNTEKFLKLIEEEGDNFLVPEAKKQSANSLREFILNETKELSEDEKSKLSLERKWDREHFPALLNNIKKLHKRGATIGVGTDSGGTSSGFFGRYADELLALTEAGFSNFEVLRMATSVNATILGMQDKIGSIEKNKLADIIAVEGNPLEDLTKLKKVDVVIKEGVFLKNTDIYD